MKSTGFTLIELLIVVAIIAILAAIAVPNFLEAQTRAKVSRVKSDFRTVDTALNSYLVDHNQFPVNRQAGSPGAYFLPWLTVPGSNITSPIAYNTSIPEVDIFAPRNAAQQNPNGFYQYFYYGEGQTENYSSGPPVNGWMLATGYANDPEKRFREVFSLVSWGPDKAQSNGEHLEFEPPYNIGGVQEPALYDPTNGTVSNGDIVRFGGATQNRFGNDN